MEIRKTRPPANRMECGPFDGRAMTSVPVGRPTRVLIVRLSRSWVLGTCQPGGLKHQRRAGDVMGRKRMTPQRADPLADGADVPGPHAEQQRSGGARRHPPASPTRQDALLGASLQEESIARNDKISSLQRLTRERRALALAALKAVGGSGKKDMRLTVQTEPLARAAGCWVTGDGCANRRAAN